MPLLKRYLTIRLSAALCASILVLLPTHSWAQGTPAVSGAVSYVPALWFGIAAMIACLWVLVLIAEYRYLCGRQAGGEHPVGQNDEYRQMLNVSPDAIMICANDRLLYANPAALNMFGASTFAELAAVRPIDLVDPECLGMAEAMRREMLTTGRGTDYSIVRHRKLDGDGIDTEVA